MASFNAVEMVNQIPPQCQLCDPLFLPQKNELPIQLRYFFKIKVMNVLKIQYLLKANAIPVM